MLGHLRKNNERKKKARRMFPTGSEYIARQKNLCWWPIAPCTLSLFNTERQLKKKTKPKNETHREKLRSFQILTSHRQKTRFRKSCPKTSNNIRVQFLQMRLLQIVNMADD